MPRCRRQFLPHARSLLLRCDVLRQPRPSGSSLFREPLCVHGYAPGPSQTGGHVYSGYIEVGTHAIDRGDVGHGGIAIGVDVGSGKCMGG
jgi:hypothetical protein